jgi:hypothetical protein
MGVLLFMELDLIVPAALVVCPSVFSLLMVYFVMIFLS